MSETVIKIENLSKEYRLGTIGTGTLRSDLQRWWAGIRGKEDPALKIGSENTLSLKDNDNQEFVWALRDINFDVNNGEVVGIIGKNGAGKSTLLKILSRVTSPTMGSIKIKGRIASLLEVGTGFHPELTGRENIFLNGAILGMTKSEINQKLDEIIEFSGVAKYIDTPVKRYSSGMHVRLAFAVAAHLEPEILIVDEVLAVGDADFQKKALGKMKDVSNTQGRTVLFVSHNMTAIQTLCNRVVLLENGKISKIGNTENVITHYLLKENKSENSFSFDSLDNAPGNESIRVKEIGVDTLNKNEPNLYVNSPIDILIDFWNLNQGNEINISLVLKNLNGDIIFNVSTESKALNNGLHRTVLHIPDNLLNDAVYTIDVYFVKNLTNVLYKCDEPITFEVHDILVENRKWFGKWVGAVRPNLKWDYYEL